MGKKPVNATVEELEAAKTELKGLIAKINKAKADKEEVQPPATKVQNNLDALAETVKKNAATVEEAVANARAEAKEHSDELYNNVRDEVLPIFPKVEEEREKGDKQLEAEIQKLDESVRTAFADELTSLCSKIEEEFSAIREELTELIELRAQQAADDTEQLRHDVFAEIEELRKQAAARDVETRSIAVEDLRKAVEVQEKVDVRIDATAVQDRKDLEAEVARLDALVVELRNDAASDTKAARSEADGALEDFRAAAHAKFDELDIRDDKQQLFLEQLDQVHVRRVEWLLQGAAALLRPPPATSPTGSQDGRESPSSTGQPRWVSHFSPKFDAAGVRNLQLELRVLFKHGASSPSGTDNCSLYLWSPKGLQMHLRFYAGEKWLTIEKGNQSEGPIGAKRMGQLQDHINIDEDSLRVGVEILEAIQEFSSEASRSLDTVQEATERGSELEDAGPGTAVTASCEGSLLFHRHLNHRVLPQVRKEVEKMQNKMVRRVEWLISEADQLDRVFQHDSPICSTVFQAAGVDGMQFIFYPMGYADSTEGFCSIFLYCPAGINLKCSLMAGTQKRDTSNHFKEAGAFGRVNFCRLDSAIDKDTNTVLLVLEIEEVVQDTKKSANHTKGDEYRKNRRQPPMLELESPAPVPPVGSAVKLVRLANRNCLTEVNRIPALWTSQALGDFVKRPDGFQDFKELTQIGKPGKPGLTHSGPGSGPFGAASRALAGAAATAPPGRGFGGGEKARSESTPALHSTSLQAERSSSMDAAVAGPDTLPLLCGPKNEFGSDQGYGSPMLWAGKSRQARTGTSFRQRT